MIKLEIKFGDFQTPPFLLYAFKQYNDVIKTIDVRFCLHPLPPYPLERTYFMDGPIRY